jgi:beta-lactamase class D
MKGLFAIMVSVVCLCSCTLNNVNTDDSLKKYFDEQQASGCFALLNNGTNEFKVYNLSRFRDSSYLPASTFKIVNSLIGLQTGVITNDSMVINWDGLDRGRKECNKDMTMYEAFRLSCPPWYMELARRIGKDTMQTWLDSLSYGKEQGKAFRIANNLDTFWLDNSLQITPDEQLGLVKRLYFNQLPFHRINQDMVKNAMLFENNSNYRLSYKTGWGQTASGNQLGWCIGWIEENGHPYFFVLNIESPDAKFNMPAARMKILKGILNQYGFFKGVK